MLDSSASIESPPARRVASHLVERHDAHPGDRYDRESERANEKKRENVSERERERRGEVGTGVQCRVSIFTG